MDQNDTAAVRARRGTGDESKRKGAGKALPSHLHDEAEAERRDRERFNASLAGSSWFGAQRVVEAAEKTGIGKVGADWDGLTDKLVAFGDKINTGDMTEVESMLAHQAIALQSIFVRLSEAAFGSKEVASFELNFRFALRAQSQARATLETLAAIKNPPAIFARQANVTTGPQQINNGVAPRARVGGFDFEPNEQSGGGHGLCQDPGTPQLALSADTALAAVGAIDRSQDAGGQGALLPQRMERR